MLLRAHTASMAQPLPPVPFFREFGYQLVAKLEIHSPESGLRPLHVCVRQDCACAGLFYLNIGGESHSICITLALERLRTAGGAVRESVPAFVRAAWVAARPQFELQHALRDGQVYETVLTRQACAFEADEGLMGVYRARLRPALTTGYASRASVRIHAGPNWCRTPDFEIRTKPSEWVLLGALSTDMSADAVSDVLRDLMPSNPVQALQVRPMLNAANPAFRMCALVRCTKRGSTWSSMALLREWIQTKHTSGWQHCTISFLLSLNRDFDSDPRLLNIVLPACTARTVRQQRARFIVAAPAPKRVAAVAAVGILDAAAPVKRQRTTADPDFISAVVDDVLPLDTCAHSDCGCLWRV